MKFSAQTEYGLKAMVNLAKSEGETKTLKSIAKEEGVSIKYLERILNILRKNGLVQSFKGASGGYVLCKPSTMISVAEIVIALEGPIELMKCSGKNCHSEEKCSLRGVWDILGREMERTLRKIKLHNTEITESVL